MKKLKPLTDKEVLEQYLEGLKGSKEVKEEKDGTVQL